MAEESDETSDDWTNALDRIDQAFTQVLDAAERLREEADADYLDVSPYATDKRANHCVAHHDNGMRWFRLT
jgi:hypothetical protein